MTARWLRWGLATALTASLVVVASYVLGIGGMAAQISVDDYAKNDQQMEKLGFHVLLDDATPPAAKPFNRIKRVYVKGKGPRVILLHELPGLRNEDIAVASALSDSFEVYVPLLFGTVGQDNTWLGNKQACHSRDANGRTLFQCNDRNTKHAITDDLTAMTKAVCGKECGVIGMCLTGSIPLYLMPVDGVVALVLAQPTLPFYLHVWPFSGVDISEQDTKTAVDLAVARKASIYMMRYRHDLLTGHHAFQRLVKRIEPSASKLTSFTQVELGGHDHSTLVEDKQQLEAVVKSLNARLRGTP